MNSENNKKYKLPEYGGKLRYLINKIKINSAGKAVPLESKLRQGLQERHYHFSSNEQDIVIKLEETIFAIITQEDSPYFFNEIHFKCKLVDMTVIKPSRPNLDPRLIPIIHTSYKYKDELSGRENKIQSKDINLGFDTTVGKDKFYYSPSLEFFYYCELVDNGVANIYLVESYQHGELSQASYWQRLDQIKSYVEVTDKAEIKRLRKLLQKMKNKENKKHKRE